MVAIECEGSSVPMRIKNDRRPSFVPPCGLVIAEDHLSIALKNPRDTVAIDYGRVVVVQTSRSVVSND
jgi:hypothetical protein